MKAQLFAAKSLTGAVNSRQQSSNLSASPRFILFWQVSKMEGGTGGDAASRDPTDKTSRDFLNRIQREPRQCCAAALCLAVLHAVCLENTCSAFYTSFGCKDSLVNLLTPLFRRNKPDKSDGMFYKSTEHISHIHLSHWESTKKKKTWKVTRLCFFLLNIAVKGYATCVSPLQWQASTTRSV